jgi:hypothetical protein
MTRMSKVEKEALAHLLAKHQKKHPSCKLGERKCKAKLAEDCIGKGDVSEFHKTAAKCKRCLVIVNRLYYAKMHPKVPSKKKKRKVTFKKGV